MNTIPDAAPTPVDHADETYRGSERHGADSRKSRRLTVAVTVLALPLLGWLAAAGEPAAIADLLGVLLGFGPVVGAVASNLGAAVDGLGVQLGLILASAAAVVVDRAAE